MSFPKDDALTVNTMWNIKVAECMFGGSAYTAAIEV